MNNPQRLKELLARRAAVTVPGAANALFARVIEELGFEAVYVTGAGIANMLLGAPDIGLTTMTEVSETVAAVADAVSVPVIVDADKKAVVKGIDHALGLAARLVAEHLDGVVAREQSRCHAIKDRRGLRPLYADRFQFANMFFQRRNIPAGPAGDHEVADCAQIERLR